jgi:hypothetical protein
MADLKLKLGDFVFKDAEVPEKISFGGEQKLAVHRLVGGGRVVDAMGRDDAALEWSGMFLGEQALARARHLDNLRIAGAPVALSWHELAYQVVIRSFHAPFERFYKIPYTIVCEVVEDKSKPLAPAAAPAIHAPPVPDLIAEDLRDAKALASKIGNQALSQAVAKIDALINKLPANCKITRMLQQKLIGAVKDAQDRAQKHMQEMIDAHGRQIQKVYDVATADRLIWQQEVSYTLNTADVINLNSHLARMLNNLGASIPGSLTITVAGGTLFDVAAKHYGDATLWTSIAIANGMNDPIISGARKLVIPSVPDQNGGVMTK